MKPDVFEYKSAFEFFSDSIESLQEEGLFSNRQFAKAAGFSFHSIVPMILSGTRRLTRYNGLKISRALELDPIEQEYFLALIDLEGADLTEEKRAFEDQLKRLQNQRSLEELPQKAVVFSNPHAQMLLQFIPDVWVSLDIPEIQKRMGWSKAEVEKAITFLVERGLLLKDSEYLRKGPQTYQVDGHVEATKLRFIQRCCAEVESDREVFSFFVSIDHADMPKLKSMIHDFVRGVQESFYTDEPHKKDCYLLNLDFLYRGNFDACIKERASKMDSQRKMNGSGDEIEK